MEVCAIGASRGVGLNKEKRILSDVFDLIFVHVSQPALSLSIYGGVELCRQPVLVRGCSLTEFFPGLFAHRVDLELQEQRPGRAMSKKRVAGVCLVCPALVQSEKEEEVRVAVRSTRGRVSANRAVVFPVLLDGCSLNPRREPFMCVSPITNGAVRSPMGAVRSPLNHK